MRSVSKTPSACAILRLLRVGITCRRHMRLANGDHACVAESEAQSPRVNPGTSRGASLRTLTIHPLAAP